jgi:RNA 2',3'-cyclic 3'-phosphodiesterase
MPANSNNIRAFIALPISKDIKNKISRIQSNMDVICNIRWVNIDKLHLTLIFIGNLESNKVELVSNRLDNIAESFSEFEVTFQGLGYFGSKKHIKVIWTGLQEGVKNLQKLHNEINAELSTYNIYTETRPYKPHLTIGRLKTKRTPQYLAESILKQQNTFIGKLNIHTINFMKSNLTSNGSVYTCLHTSRLNSGNSL